MSGQVDNPGACMDRPINLLFAFARPLLAAAMILSVGLPTKPSVSFAERPDSNVLQTGDILQEEVPRDTKGWLGLYRREDGYVVEPVRLTIEPYLHPLADDEREKDPALWTGRTAKAEPISEKVRSELERLSKESDPDKAAPLILFRLPRVREHRVATAFPGNGAREERQEGSFAPLEAIDFDLGSKSYRLSGSFHETMCELKLSDTTPAASAGDTPPPQLLGRKWPEEGELHSYKSRSYIPLYCQQGGAMYPRVIWAGDLDGDGRLDLLLEYDTDSTYVRSLFVSSVAGKGDHVKLLGSFTRPSGC